MTEPSLHFFRRAGLKTTVACTALLACFAVTALWANSKKCATYDEPLHFVSAWAAYHYGDYRCDTEDPPLWKYVAALGTHASEMNIDLHSDEAQQMNENPYAGSLFAVDTLYLQNDADALLRPAHLRMIFLGMVLGGLIALWAWRLKGAIAAITATVLFSFDPNFMAHAPLIKNDVAISLITLWLGYSVWRLGEKITLPRIISTCAALGAALATKYTGVLFIPMLAILLLGRAMLRAPWPMSKGNLGHRSQRFAAASIIFFLAILFGYGAIWASYGFRFNAGLDIAADVQIANVEEALNEQHVVAMPEPAVRMAMGAAHQNSWKVNLILLAERKHLLPQSWLCGFLFTYGNSLVRPSFLLNRVSLSGYWYYFPLVILFKTPLVTLTAIGIALVIACKSARTAPLLGANLWPAMCLVLPPGLYLATAMNSHMNLGVRHILLIYPFIFIGIGVAADFAWRHWPRITSIAALVIVLGLLAENLLAWPNYIPFFNAPSAAFGKINLLSDSNLDWGQDLPLLAQWQRAHPDRPILLCYFGQAMPRYYGIRYINLLGSNSGPDLTGEIPPDAVLVVSAANLQGTYLATNKHRIYAPLRNVTPIAVLGGSIYIFDNEKHAMAESK